MGVRHCVAARSFYAHRVFLRHVHNFRAIAITIIVAGHVLDLLNRESDPRTVDFLLDLLDNGTILFVFIAGFLFEHLSGRFRYLPYLRKKLLNVIVPYLLISIPAVLYTVYLGDGPALPEWVRESPKPVQVALMLLTGGGTVDYALWFVPMIAMLYLAAPVFMVFVRHPRLYPLVIPLLLVCTIVHRPPQTLTPIVAIYFMPVYILGMWVSRERGRVEPVLRRSGWVLGALFVAAVVDRFLVSPWHGGENPKGLFTGEYGLIDWMFPMKLLLCFALLGVMLRLDSWIGDRLKFLGDISFTIFFLHCYVLYLVQVEYPRFTGTDPPGNFLTWLGVTVFTLGVTIGAVACAKAVLGRRSRYLIGS